FHRIVLELLKTVADVARCGVGRFVDVYQVSRRKAVTLPGLRQELKHTNGAHGVWRLNVYIRRLDPGKIEADERRHVTRFERSNQHGCLALAPFDDFAQITISESAAVSSDPLCVTINLLLNVLDVRGGEI